MHHKCGHYVMKELGIQSIIEKGDHFTEEERL